MIYQITENDTILHEVFHHNNMTVHDCDEIETNVHWVYQNNKTYQTRITIYRLLVLMIFMV